MVASIPSRNLYELLDRPPSRRDEGPVIVDVRRQPAFLSSPVILPGSLRREPETVAEWQSGLPRHRQIVVYCVHGHEVSQGVAKALAAAGFDTAYLECGIEGWADAGLPVDKNRRRSGVQEGQD